jgi:hypothetical protein
MKNIFLASMLFFTGISVNAQIKVNDANAVKRNVTGFNAISISNALTVYLSQGGEESLAVSASESDMIADIKTEVKNGTLRIWVDSHDKWNKSKQNMKVYVSFKNLDKLSINGACTVYFADKVKSNSLKIDMSGASNLKGNVEVENLVVSLNGATDVKFEGTATTLQIDASGASNFKGYDMVVDYCKAKITGASDIKLTVNKEITGNASGASSIYLKGKGDKSDFKTSGVSSIKVI